MTRMLLFFVPLSLVGCTENGLALLPDYTPDPTPIIVVDPVVVDFGSVLPGETVIESITISNHGDALLEVDEMLLDNLDASAFTILSETYHLLQPEGSAIVDIAFTPSGSAITSEFARVYSNDPANSEVPVQLSGFGIVPELEITPNPHDFGTHLVQCGDDVDLTLSNVGFADLLLTTFDYTGDTSHLDFSGPLLPMVLTPGQSRRTTVSYVPLSDGPHTATLSVASNDPRGVQTATQTGIGEYGGRDNESFIAGSNQPVDILFAVDQSCSMDDDAANLADNFQTFIQTVGTITSNWHIGVVTYDNGCFNSGVLESTTPDLGTIFSDAVTLGDDLDISDDERLLKMLDRALQQTAPGQCNDGFLRPGALLHMIVVSDEPDRSHELASAWTWDFWVPRLQTYASNPTLARISGVIDLDWCNEGPDGYESAIGVTGGEKLSICALDWAQHVAVLANASVTVANGVTLSQQANGADLAVTVNGTPTTAWSFDPQTNTVVFDSPLPPGALVNVDYGVVYACP